LITSFSLGLTGIGFMFLLLLLRQPVWLALAICGIAGNFILNSISMTKFVVGTGTFDIASGYALSVIPLFILMGEVASGSRMSRDLFDAARVVLSGLRGGLAIATIAASGAFGAICGSSVATAASMTRIALPEMRRAGYERGYAASSVAAGGSLGILIPPSIILVIYGSISETSVARLFAASMIPGIMLLLLYILVAWVLARGAVVTGTGLIATFRERLIAITRPWHFLLLFIATIGGIYTGVFSPNEAASIGAFGAIVIGFLRRTLNWAGFVTAVQASVLISCGLFLIIIGAKIFAIFIVQTRLPDTLLYFFQNAEVSPFWVMLMIVVLYIVMGCFLEGIGMVLITVPVFLPVIEGYGFDPIWFGVLVAVLVELGLITPPVGMNLFIIRAQVENMTMGAIYRAILPFLVAPVILILLLFLKPNIALWLPNLLF
tara:strand:- start:4408 stop:5709 length:1302 start_codon:yes stop_codon:yes gene_type:complete